MHITQLSNLQQIKIIIILLLSQNNVPRYTVYRGIFSRLIPWTKFWEPPIP